MDKQNLTHQNLTDQYKQKKVFIVSVGISILVIAVCIAFVLCNLQVKYITQQILENQRESQQAWIDKSLESIRVWKTKILEQSHFISSAEMFRLFASDMLDLSIEEKQLLTSPEKITNKNEALSSIAEQLTYMSDILKDFITRRDWENATIVDLNGTTLIAQKPNTKLNNNQSSLIKRAQESKSVVFGPIYKLNNKFVIDLVDPLYEVLGTGEPKPIAFLILTIPIEKDVKAFLEIDPEQNQNIFPCILEQKITKPEAVKIENNNIVISEVLFNPDSENNLQFMRRQSLTNKSDVYSLGNRLTDLGWMIIIETPTNIVDKYIKGQQKQIYGLGILGSLGVALLLAFIWANMMSRSHRATAEHFKRLYTLIRQQKLLLDSMNASLKAGLLLVDGNGLAQVCNPAFCQIVDKDESNILQNTLHGIFHEKVAETLITGIKKVNSNKNMDSIEISVEHPDETRLYRVTLFPFESAKGDNEHSSGGCVGIFQDITEFRRKAEAARERQASIIMALVRAIESVDENLIGHSQKLETVSTILADAMNLSNQDKETLRLASRLSQVGKIFVPHHLLTKKGKLTEEEQHEVSRAPEYAYKVLRDLQFGLPVPEAVYQMGERMNGTGQPRGLKGNEIVLNARILAAVNAFCAMVSDRSYRAGMPISKALEILSNDDSFDQAIIKEIANLPEEILNKVLKSQKETCENEL